MHSSFRRDTVAAFQLLADLLVSIQRYETFESTIVSLYRVITKLIIIIYH